MKTQIVLIMFYFMYLKSVCPYEPAVPATPVDKPIFKISCSWSNFNETAYWSLKQHLNVYMNFGTGYVTLKIILGGRYYSNDMKI